MAALALLPLGGGQVTVKTGAPGHAAHEDDENREHAGNHQNLNADLIAAGHLPQIAHVGRHAEEIELGLWDLSHDRRHRLDHADGIEPVPGAATPEHDQIVGSDSRVNALENRPVVTGVHSPANGVP